MGDGIGGHEQLETEEAGQQMVFHEPRPQAGIPLLAELVLDQFDDGIEKRPRAAGGIEDEDAGAGGKLPLREGLGVWGWG